LTPNASRKQARASSPLVSVDDDADADFVLINYLI
jgi:hypothetical protein